MKTYCVSLNLLSSPTITISSVAEALGVSESCLKMRETKKNDLEWILESKIGDENELEEHIDCILSYLSTDVIHADDTLKRIYLLVGVFHSTVTCTVNIPATHLHRLLSKLPEVVLEITCYPCGETE